MKVHSTIHSHQRQSYVIERNASKYTIIFEHLLLLFHEGGLEYSERSFVQRYFFSNSPSGTLFVFFHSCSLRDKVEYDSVILKAMEKKAALINLPQWLIMKDVFVILGFVLRV